MCTESEDRFMVYDVQRLQKLAFSPFTEDAQMAAQQGGQPPMDPSMMQGGMPMDPAMAQGGMPAQGAPAPIQTVPGPNGEPIDPETGFIVIDPQQGLEQDPLTGILFSKFTQEFMTPDGQPMDPNQAMQMIEQALMQQQGGGMPADPAMMQGGMPTDQAMAQEQPPMAPAPAPQQGAGQTFDPSTGQMIDDATGMPVDQATGMLIDPATGQMIDPNTGAVAPGAQQMPMFDDPEIMTQVQEVLKEVPNMAKELSRIEKQDNRLRTDIQGLRREMQTMNDNQDALLSRVDNAVALIEQLLGGR
jgi:tetrahydromethanopterin S-methyltransferase subunit B